MNRAPTMAARWIGASALIGAGAAAGLLVAPAWLAALLGLLFGAGSVWLVLARRADPDASRWRDLSARIARLAQGISGADPSAGVVGSDAHVAAIEARLAGTARLLDAADAPIVATDERGRVTYCNRSAEGLIGVRADRLVGRAIDEAFTQADLLRLHASARAGRAGVGRVRIARPDSAGVFDAAAVPLEEERTDPDAPRAVVMTLRDVTELSRSVQVKSDFVANASHELRTPIAALRIAVETLLGGAADDPAMRTRLLGVIESHTIRLEEMVRDLMDLSRLESPDVPVRAEAVPASELRDALAPLFEPACRERGLTLAFDFDPTLESMRTDRDLLMLILKNLIDNAVKFAFDNTEVRVEGRAVDAEGGRRGTNRTARFEVIDRGIGIPLSQQQRIFERFYQVDPARSGVSPRRGSGLGLAIVKHAVKSLGGTIRVQSVWHQGTTMTVELPGVVPGSDAAFAPRDEPHPSPSGARV